LPGWTLGSDGKTYTATYDKNTTFITNFTSLYGVITAQEIKINQIDDKGPKLNISYKLNEDNTVTVTVIANEEMKVKTLPGWNLGVDKKTYTATYDKNTTFTTNFTDLQENKTSKEIKINQIDETRKPKLNISYKLNTNNTVTVTVISDIKLKVKTLPGWKLGTDGKTYTATYGENTTFTTNFTTLYGIVIPQEIKIHQLGGEAPKVKVSYKLNEDNTVTVTVISNEEMKVKTLSGWKLSEDKKTYTAVYDVNTTFITNFTDLYGNKTPQEIKINQIDEIRKPKLNISYKLNANNTVTVTVTSDIKLKKKTLTGWNLGADGKTYKATYENNTTFTTNFTSLYGIVSSEIINITQIKETA